VPAAPGELTAERRGDSVEITFTIPSSNSDKTRPANLERVDVYGATATAQMTDAEVISRGERIASVEVKAPRDPGRTIDPDQPASDLEPLEGGGLDQGVATEVFDELAPLPASQATAQEIENGRPLPGPPCDVATRTYVGVGISTDGRRGAFSRQASVPLAAAPSPPSRPAVSYDESGVTVTWMAGEEPGAATPSGQNTVLESRPMGCAVPAVAYHVYEVGAERFETRLTEKPVAAPPFVDKRVEWGVERCYTVRAVHTVDARSVESDPAAPVCEMLSDTFPPAAPKGLIAIASAGVINLIWDANAEKDVAGYIVRRAPAATRTFTAATPEPVPTTSFSDKVEPGTLFIYTILAVDTAGNRSEPSAESTPDAAR
jgi:hypothetical protein